MRLRILFATAALSVAALAAGCSTEEPKKNDTNNPNVEAADMHTVSLELPAMV